MRRSANRAPRAAGDRMTINGIELEVLRRGSGPPLLLLHGMDTVHPGSQFLDLLGRQHEYWRAKTRPV